MHLASRKGPLFYKKTTPHFPPFLQPPHFIFCLRAWRELRTVRVVNCWSGRRDGDGCYLFDRLGLDGGRGGRGRREKEVGDVGELVRQTVLLARQRRLPTHRRRRRRVHAAQPRSTPHYTTAPAVWELTTANCSR